MLMSNHLMPKKDMFIDGKGKTNSQPICNHDIKCFMCLESVHISL